MDTCNNMEEFKKYVKKKEQVTRVHTVWFKYIKSKGRQNPTALYRNVHMDGKTINKSMKKKRVQWLTTVRKVEIIRKGNMGTFWTTIKILYLDVVGII